MKCDLCQLEMKNYHPELNHLVIDENNSYYICQECVDKFMKWQQGIYARLFPTNLMKKKFNSK